MSGVKFVDNADVLARLAVLPVGLLVIAHARLRLLPALVSVRLIVEGNGGVSEGLTLKLATGPAFAMIVNDRVF